VAFSSDLTQWKHSTRDWRTWRVISVEGVVSIITILPDALQAQIEKIRPAPPKPRKPLLGKWVDGKLQYNGSQLEVYVPILGADDDGWYWLGQSTSKKCLLVKETIPGMLGPIGNFDMVWSDQGGFSVGKRSIWRPVPSNTSNYRSLGCYYKGGENVDNYLAPSAADREASGTSLFSKLRAVHRDCVIPHGVTPRFWQHGILRTHPAGAYRCCDCHISVENDHVTNTQFVVSVNHSVWKEVGLPPPKGFWDSVLQGVVGDSGRLIYSGVTGYTTGDEALVHPGGAWVIREAMIEMIQD